MQDTSNPAKEKEKNEIPRGIVPDLRHRLSFQLYDVDPGKDAPSLASLGDNTCSSSLREAQYLSQRAMAALYRCLTRIGWASRLHTEYSTSSYRISALLEPTLSTVANSNRLIGISPAIAVESV